MKLIFRVKWLVQVSRRSLRFLGHGSKVLVGRVNAYR